MGKFLLVLAAIGAIGVTGYMCLQHPTEVRSKMSQGVGGAASAIASSVSAGASAAQSAINTPPAPPKADKK